MSHGPGELDYLIIGAQKSGTTTLYQYLRGHPSLYMPSAKEADYFTVERAYRAGWPAFAARHYAGADPSQMWGGAPVRCMCHGGAAARIHRAFPNVKLIAILRDPVERAVSHYMMSRRRGHESQELEEALRECLDPARLLEARRMGWSVAAETRCYLAWGEYGRILTEYLRWFERDQMLILTTDELSARPEETLRRVLAFLDVDTGYVPANLGRMYHVGGGERRLARFLPFMQNPVTRSPWRYLPGRSRGRLRAWWDRTDIRRDERPRRELLSRGLRLALIEHFDPDVEVLREALGVRPSWPGYPSLAD